jgi:hypothetical protein
MQDWGCGGQGNTFTLWTESAAMPERREIRNYCDLAVWQLGMDIAVEVYSVSKEFPADERFGLTSQIRRAAASVSANIAEGAREIVDQGLPAIYCNCHRITRRNSNIH